MKTNAAVAGGLIIAKQVGRPFVRGHENILIAIAIEVAHRQAAPDLGFMEPAADLVGHVAKVALAVIQKQVRGLGIAHIAYVANRVIDMAVDRDQVERAIEVAIDKSAAKAKR